VADTKRIVVLVSGHGSNLQALIEAAADPAYGARVVLVVSDRPDAFALERARAAGIDTAVVRLADHDDRQTFDLAIRDTVAEARPDVVCLAGFMKILGPEFVRAFPNRIINTHPSLLPAFPGAHPVRDTLAYGVRVTGCTVHIVDEQVDHGPVLLQVAVPIEEDDDEERLHERIKVQERRLLPAAAHLVAAGRFHLSGRRAVLDANHGGDGGDGDRSATPARRSDPAIPQGGGNVPDRQPIRRALVSVFDKRGLDLLAGALRAAGVEVVSTGSTAAVLRGHGLEVTSVEALTGAPEMLGGRVKTLHPRVHAGLLADMTDADHRAELEAAGIEPFDLVVVNLYPFEEVVADPATSAELAIERIDVGGPSMLRAAAKNHASVAVVCDPDDYGLVERALAEGGTSLAERRGLAATAFARSAAYDAAIAAWFADRVAEGAEAAAREGAGAPAGSAVLPAILPVAARRRQELRYGENPHQAAAFYATTQPGSARPWGLAAAEQLAGKELSYNNLLDADAAMNMVADHADRTFAVIVKHTNPCGAAWGDRLADAYSAALEGDPVSAFGGIVGLSRPLDAETARRIAEIFTEVVVAPGFDDEALEVLAPKRSLRLVRVDLWRPPRSALLRSVAGGLLAQEPDLGRDDPSGWTPVSGEQPTGDTLADLELAWSAAKHVKSNAIVLARDGRLVGVGAGQQNRVEAARIAVAKAGERAKGAAAGSDAYFPFPDGLEVLAAAGVAAVAQPGGSVRDDEVTAAANQAGITMLHTGRRHFRH
jgi:phosphoribosylaminoimidazolecarboxamide formyltransferase / IMP cyclohydrolase